MPRSPPGVLARAISLDDAWELRGYPARLVQEVWPQAPSVAGVVAELAHL